MRKRFTILTLIALSFAIPSCSSASESVELKLVDKYKGYYEVGQAIDIETFFYCSDRSKGEVTVTYSDDEGESHTDKIVGNIYFPKFAGEYTFIYKVDKKSISKKITVSYTKPSLSVDNKPYVTKAGGYVYFEDVFAEVYPTVSPTSATLEIIGVDYQTPNKSLDYGSGEFTEVEWDEESFKAKEVGSYRVHLCAHNGDKSVENVLYVEAIKQLKDGNDKVYQLDNGKYASNRLMTFDNNSNLFHISAASYQDSGYVVLNDNYKLGETIGVRFKGKNLPQFGFCAEGNSQGNFSPYAIDGYFLTFEAKGTGRYVVCAPNLAGNTYKVAVDSEEQNRHEFFGLEDLEDDKYYVVTAALSGNTAITSGTYAGKRTHYIQWEFREILNYGTDDEIYSEPIKTLAPSGFMDDRDIPEVTHVVLYGSYYSSITFEVERGMKEVEPNIFVDSGNKSAAKTYTFKAATATNNKTTGHQVSSGFLAYKGEYSTGNTVAFDFHGKNIPGVCLFADKLSGMVEGKGLYISPSTKDPALRQRLTIYGPNRLDAADPSKYSQYEILGYNDRLYTEKDSPFGIENLDENKDYTYQVSIGEIKDNIVNLSISLYERVNGNFTLVHQSNPVVNNYTGPISGSIIAYPDFVYDTTIKYYPINGSPVKTNGAYKSNEIRGNW